MLSPFKKSTPALVHGTDQKQYKVIMVDMKTTSIEPGTFQKMHLMGCNELSIHYYVMF